jgi:hypothetical protein
VIPGAAVNRRQKWWWWLDEIDTWMRGFEDRKRAALTHVNRTGDPDDLFTPREAAAVLAIRYAQVRDMIGGNVIELVAGACRSSGARDDRETDPGPVRSGAGGAAGVRGQGRGDGGCASGGVAWDVLGVRGGLGRGARPLGLEDGRLKKEWAKRTLELPRLGVTALRGQWERQQTEREVAGAVWVETDLVFTWEDGTGYSKDSLGYYFSKITRKAGLGHWHPNETRHAGVSIMSNNGVEIRDIGDMAGHKNTNVTETVYRHVIAPSVTGSASVMDDVFSRGGDA